MKLTEQEENRLWELEDKNSRGDDPRLSIQELNELQSLLEKYYDDAYEKSN